MRDGDASAAGSGPTRSQPHRDFYEHEHFDLDVGVGLRRRELVERECCAQLTTFLAEDVLAYDREIVEPRGGRCRPRSLGRHQSALSRRMPRRERMADKGSALGL